MATLPTPPEVDYSYSGFAAGLGDGTFPGTQLDNDLANLVAAAEDATDFIASVFRADGKLKASALPLEADLESEVGNSTQVTASGTSTARALAERFGDFRTVRDYGAAGDGATDDTAAIQAAVDAGGTLVVPGGTYMVSEIVVDTVAHLVLAPDAVLKRLLPASPATALDATHWIVKFVVGSSGSSIRGGTIDGNRAVLAPYYAGHTRLGQDNHWGGIRTEFVDGITVDRVAIRNVMHEAVYFYGGDRCRAEIDVRDCGLAFALQGTPGVLARHDMTCRAENVSNYVGGLPYYIFQHGATAGFLRNSVIRLQLSNFGGSAQGTDGDSTSGGKEPVPAGLSCYALRTCRVEAILDGYAAAAPAPHVAVNLSSARDSQFRVIVKDYECGLNLGSAQNCEFDVMLDGGYCNVAGYARPGILATFGGVFDVVAAGLAGETGANNVTDGCTIRGRVQRFGIGVRDEGADITYAPGFTVLGCSSDGIQLVGPSGASASYPVTRNRPNGRRLLSGCVVRSNGNSGVVYTRGMHDVIRDCDIRGNGQRPSGGAPYGVYVLADAGEGKYLSIVDNDLEPGETITDTGGLSFVPGTATAAPANRRYDEVATLAWIYQFTLRNPNNWDVGQWVVLKNVLSGPADATGKIVDISADIATIAFATQYTFTDASVLTNLTGTGSTSGTALTGSGTAFTTEVDFPALLKSGSEYRRISYVNSNTAAVLASAFTVAMPGGSTLQVVRADIVTSSYVQTRGYYVNGNVTAGPMLIRGNKTRRVSNFITVGSFAGLARGSEVLLDYSLTMAGTALSNQIVNGLPNFCTMFDVQLTIGTTITGFGGTLSIEVRDNASVIATPIPTFSGVTAGTVLRGPMGACPAVTSGLMGVHLVSSSGNPSGVVTARVGLRKLSEVA